MKSNNITDTEARLGNILVNFNNSMIEKTVPQKIENAMKDVFVRTGVITRFYPYIDKAQVRLDFTGELMLCKILHRYGGDLLELYTPSSAKGGYDDKVHERYVVPKAELNVCILKINDKDSEENLILGYYQNEEIVGFNPAKPGNIKLTSLLEDGDEYWVKFGKDGFNYQLSKTPRMEVGSMFDENGYEEINYAKEGEYYNKNEVDELISNIEVTGTGDIVDIGEDYYNKTEVDTLLEGYYTETESNNRYYTKNDITTNYYNKNSVDGYVNALQDEIDSINSNVDLTNYVKKSDVSFTVVNQPNGHLIFNLYMG